MEVRSGRAGILRPSLLLPRIEVGSKDRKEKEKEDRSVATFEEEGVVLRRSV